MFNSIDVQVKSLARKSYRATPLNLWIYLEGDSLPHELCNISISGLCFKLNTEEQQEELNVGKILQIHIFSEVHDDILTLDAQVVRTTEETCSCFFPKILPKEEVFLDKLILEMQKQMITQRKLGHKKELEREKLQVQELRRLQQLNRLRLEEIHSQSRGIAINPVVNGQKTDLDHLAQSLSQKVNLEELNELHKTAVKKVTDFTLFEDINIFTDSQNRKTYRTNPTSLWVYIKGVLRPHKIMNLSTSGICFKYKPTQNILQIDDKIELEIFYHVREKIFATQAKVVRFDENTCSCMFPSFAGENMVFLSKLVAEMKKYEISADTLEELRGLMLAYETHDMEDKKHQLEALDREEARIRHSKARLLAIVEEEVRIKHEKFHYKQRQVQEYIEQTKSKDGQEKNAR